MTPLVFLLGAIALIILLMSIYANDSGVGIIASILCAVLACLSWQSNETKAAIEVAEKKKRQEDAQPRKISEADGCSVYTFNPNGSRWLYFTKCTNGEVTTQNIYSVPNGKTTRTETLEIKTK